MSSTSGLTGIRCEQADTITRQTNGQTSTMSGQTCTTPWLTRNNRLS